MAYADVYSQRVGMQEQLDEVFPDGAWVQTLVVEDSRPIGPEMVTGRVFCSDALLEGAVWRYELFMDERLSDTEEDGGQGYVKPYRVWVDSIEESELGIDEVYDCLITYPEDAVSEGVFLRLSGNPSGSRKVPAGAREYQTERWGEYMFPYGVEVIEV